MACVISPEWLARSDRPPGGGPRSVVRQALCYIQWRVAQTQQLGGNLCHQWAFFGKRSGLKAPLQDKSFPDWESPGGTKMSVEIDFGTSNPSAKRIVRHA